MWYFHITCMFNLIPNSMQCPCSHDLLYPYCRSHSSCAGNARVGPGQVTVSVRTLIRHATRVHVQDQTGTFSVWTPIIMECWSYSNVTGECVSYCFSIRTPTTISSLLFLFPIKLNSNQIIPCCLLEGIVIIPQIVNMKPVVSALSH